MSFESESFVHEVAAGRHPVDVETLRYSERCYTNRIAGVPLMLVQQGEWAR